MKLFTTLLAFVIFNTCYGQFKEVRPLNKHNKIYVATGVNVEYIKSNKNEIIIETEKKNWLIY